MELVKREAIESFEGNGRFRVGMSDGCRTIVGDNGMKSSAARLYMHCSICEKDSEMYGDGIFKISRRQAETFRGCGCCNKPNHSEKQNTILIKRACSIDNYTFKGFVGDYKGVSTRLNLVCDKGHTYQSTSISKFLGCKRRCPVCAGNIPWDEKRFLDSVGEVHGTLYNYPDTSTITSSKSKITVVCKTHGAWKTTPQHHISRKQGCPHPACCWTKISENKASCTEDFIVKAKNIHGDKYNYDNTVYSRAFNKVRILCNTCKTPFTQTAADHLAGNGCPPCKGQTQKQLYVFGVYDANNIIAIKSGIAIDFNKRVVRQNRMSVYEVKPITVFTFEDTEDCKAAERECKQKLNSGFLSKDEYLDGYKETYTVGDIDNIKAIALKYKGVQALEENFNVHL